MKPQPTMKTKEEIEAMLLSWQGNVNDCKEELALITAADVLYSKKDRKRYKQLQRNISGSYARIGTLQQVLGLPVG